MNNYIYRIDTSTGLKNIQDGYFRARKWENDYPHILLEFLSTSLQENEKIYRICFYTNLQTAKKALDNDFSWFGESYISRCPKEIILANGFTESWDDGFKTSEACLFWVKEPIAENNLKFSFSGIPINTFDVLINNEWIPLMNYIDGTCENVQR